MKISLILIVFAFEFILFSNAKSGEEQFALVQFIHNSSDSRLEKVDIYANGTLIADNIEFQSATNYMYLLANTEYHFSINHNTSIGFTDQVLAVNSFPLFKPYGEYVIIINGVGLGDFNLGSKDRNIALNLSIFNGIKGDVFPEVIELNLYHGVTDAPSFDIYDNKNKSLVSSNLKYDNAMGWKTIKDINSEIKISENLDIFSQYGIFNIPFSEFKGKSLFLITSGFLTPDDEPDGNKERGFESYVVTSDGTVILLDLVSSVDRNLSESSNLYPNPSSNMIEIVLKDAFSKSYNIYNNNSELMLSNLFENQSKIKINMSQLTSGKYFIIIETDKGQVFKSFLISK